MIWKPATVGNIWSSVLKTRCPGPLIITDKYPLNYVIGIFYSFKKYHESWINTLIVTKSAEASVFMLGTFRGFITNIGLLQWFVIDLSNVSRPLIMSWKSENMKKLQSRSLHVTWCHSKFPEANIDAYIINHNILSVNEPMR